MLKNTKMNLKIKRKIPKFSSKKKKVDYKKSDNNFQWS